MKSRLTRCSLVAAVLLAGILSACGANGEESGDPKDFSASVSLNFLTLAGNAHAGARIYLRVNDPATENTVHSVEMSTDSTGAATFSHLPAGDYVLFFTDDENRPCKHRVNLSQFTGENAGALIDDCVF